MKTLFTFSFSLLVLLAAACSSKSSGVTMEDLNAKRAEVEALVADGELSETEIPQYEAIVGELREMSLDFVRANLDNQQGADVFVGLNTTGSGNVVAQADLWDVFDGFSDEMKALPGMISFRESMDAQKALEAKFGGRYIEIESVSPSGETVKLSEVVAANKYTLIDFWASWCGPCIRELPYLKEAYGEYHDRGFEIFGVTLDDDAEAWKAAIKEYEMGWVHVGSVQGWQEPAAVLYGVRSIPASWLVDGEGNIVARNLRGKAVVDKLAELLK